jgi:UDP:flavonoid glycosyltransferase YjiC (YdhE family)
MKIVFSGLPAYGHLYPMLPLAQACAEAGHEVTFATGEPFVDRLPLPTMRSVVGVKFTEFEQEVARRYPEIMAGMPATALQFPTKLFGEVCAEHTAANLIPAFSRIKPDLVVYEVADVGAAVAANVLGIPAVAFGLGQWNPILTLWHDTAAQHQSSRWVTPPSLLRQYLDPMPPSLQNSPAGRISIRSVPWSEDGAPVSWRTGRPKVYITLGTVAFGAVDVLRRAILETAEHEVEIVVAVGPEGDPALLGATPDNVIVERFVSQESVLRQVDLVVHHGGSGTMLGALSNGLPQLILPQGADQFFNADAITKIQAGLGLRNEEQVPGAISAAVGELLTDGPQRVSAKRLANEIASMPSPADVVPLLESCLR